MRLATPFTARPLPACPDAVRRPAPRWRHLPCLAAIALAGCATSNDPPVARAPAPRAAACPADLPAGARCFMGEDAYGAPYWAALPAQWTPRHGVLVVHAHGGPALGESTHRRSEADLTRWAVTVQAGHAWVGAAYRRGGLGVRMAAEDVERARQAFVQHFGTPRRTLLHGQSYGGGVASIAAEMYAPADGKGKSPYDGLLLTSGVLGGGVTAYTFRLDLRAVYQAVCKNHPLPDEPAYPLWMGLPEDARLSRNELAARVRDCTGIGAPPASRSDEQLARLKAITQAVPVDERSLLPHLLWATWHFQDLTQKRLGGHNPFTNTGARYRHAGTPEAQDAFNASVPRYAADPEAVAQLDADSQPTGKTRLPTLTLHGIHDPTAFVELETVYRDIRERAGTADMLVQNYSQSIEHSYLQSPEYVALFDALLAWIDQGTKPTPDSIAARCAALEPRYGEDGKSPCRLRPEYRSGPLAARVAPR